jgi:LacI family transcriptional regulator
MATQKLLASGKTFSATFVYNDAMAIGAISNLEDNGFSVPSKISILGCDDILLSRYSRPKLSTLNYPIEEMAMQAANIALELTDKALPTTNDKDSMHIPRLL